MVRMALSSFLTIFIFLLRVAFFIVTERKGLRGMQLRKGPNKVRLKALAQAVSDGVKLLSKGWAVPSSANKILFLFGPIFCFFLSYVIWVIFPAFFSCRYYSLSLLFFLCISCINVYRILLVGWSSNSQYAFLGAIRAVAQRISYEVSMRIILFCPLLFCGSFELAYFREDCFSYIFLCLEVLVLWMLRVLAETNRAPFDFVEGESELVSGYNVEFGGFGFALIALAEYGNIIFISLISVVIFFRGLVRGGVVIEVSFGLIVFLVSFSIIWVRGSFPRFRYDKLIWVC